jgi:hypothetical protein
VILFADGKLNLQNQALSKPPPATPFETCAEVWRPPVSAPSAGKKGFLGKINLQAGINYSDFFVKPVLSNLTGTGIDLRTQTRKLWRVAIRQNLTTRLPSISGQDQPAV